MEGPGESVTRLRVVRGLPSRTAQAWQLVMSEPGYAPDFVVTDADAAQLSAVASLFPQTVVIPCMFHLRRRLEDSLADLPGAFTGRTGDRHLRPQLRAHLIKLTDRRALENPDHVRDWWDRWAAIHDELDLSTERLWRQRARHEGLMDAAVTSIREHPTLPLSVGALEAIQNTTLRPAFAHRAGGFANIERTNALLDLIVAGHRHVFDHPNKVADLLRADAADAGGFATPLRWVEDPRHGSTTYSSLRDPALVTDLAEQRGFL